MKNLKLIELFDLYQNLLTERELEYFKLYYEEDLSLKEISEYFKITRSAVQKTLKKVEEKLNDLEIKLKLKEKKEKINNILKSNDLEKIKQEIDKIF